jgi:hypothetical protein
MVDWIAITSACALAAAVGLGLVAWERYEGRRLARARRHRRVLPYRRRHVETSFDARRRAA